MEFLSYLPLKFYLFWKSKQYFMFFIFINKHFESFLIFNLRISQKVKTAKKGNPKTNNRQIFTSVSVLPLRLK